ncbi:MAG: hypothetical protein WCQ32_00885 [bacterium]
MEKTATSGQFRTLVGGLLTTNDEAINTIDGELIQKAINEMGNGSTRAEFIKWINNGCRLTPVLTNTFTVGDVFNNKVSKEGTSLFFSDNFKEWIINPFYKKNITIPSFSCKKVFEYLIPENINGSEVDERNFTPASMEIEDFLLILYLFIFQPILGKELFGYELEKEQHYMFHVLLNGKKITCFLSKYGGGYNFNARIFNFSTWYTGRLFLCLINK